MRQIQEFFHTYLCYLTNQLLEWTKSFFSEIDEGRSNLVTETLLFYSCFFCHLTLLITNNFNKRDNESIPAALLILNQILSNSSSEERRAYNSFQWVALVLIMYIFKNRWTLSSPVLIWYAYTCSHAYGSYCLEKHLGNILASAVAINFSVSSLWIAGLAIQFNDFYRQLLVSQTFDINQSQSSKEQ